MANASRKYAEELVGPLQTSQYDTQRDVSQNTFGTNWDKLQNQYKNLTEGLKKRQEEANNQFAMGLVDVSENSLDRTRSNEQALATRGLSSSGMSNLVKQADTAAKGEEILSMLKTAGDVSSDVANQLSQGNTALAAEESNLVASLADTLGNIGAGQTNAQMSYNAGLADIAGAKDSRDMDNALQAAQRALSGSSSGGGESDEIDDALEEAYKRAAINEYIINPELTDQQKNNALKIYFDINSPQGVLDAYAQNSTLQDSLMDFNSNVGSLQKGVDSAGKNTISDYFNAVLGSMFSNKPLEGQLRMNTDVQTALAKKELENYIKNNQPNMSYNELAELLYGKK